jgi:hypothetical protein
MKISHLTFKKSVIPGKDPLKLIFLELLPISYITAVWHKECTGMQNKITGSYAHYRNLHKECDGKQKNDLNSRHITEI